MKTEKISLNGQSLNVDFITEDTFCIHFADRDIHLQYKQDNEGADHWIDLSTNDETEEAVALGELIKPFI